MLHTELCLQLKTGFLTLKDVRLTALLKPIMRDLDLECLASSGAWCLTPSIQLELALLHWCWPLQGDALIYTGYKIPSKYNSFRIRKILTYCSCICLRLFSEQWMLQKVSRFILYLNHLRAIIFQVKCMPGVQAMWDGAKETCFASWRPCIVCRVFLYNQCT